jgi:hypothetical protein
MMLSGCGPKPGEWTLPTGTPVAMKAGPSEAVVVFMRPSTFRGGRISVIIDQNKKFYGEVPPRTFLVARVAPGKHRFIIWPRFKSVPLDADLKAGHTYYVEVAYAYKSAKLFAVAPRTKQWHKLRSFLTVYDEEPIREAFPDMARGQAEVDSNEGWTRGAIEIAAEEWADLDPDETSLHVLNPDDGVEEPMAR